MAATKSSITLLSGVPTPITAAGGTTPRITNTSGFAIRLQGGVGAATLVASDFIGGLEIPARGSITPDLTIAQLFPGVTGADRIWALSYINGEISVQHG